MKLTLCECNATSLMASQHNFKLGTIKLTPKINMLNISSEIGLKWMPWDHADDDS